ncbi:hypothetical protein MSPP1_001153 [Malassezia sp. CBS 17886]|nr:hypothetical protein MSPP1_001153 [Malassezia sp. CBS 17886]
MSSGAQAASPPRRPSQHPTESPAARSPATGSPALRSSATQSPRSSHAGSPARHPTSSACVALPEGLARVPATTGAASAEELSTVVVKGSRAALRRQQSASTRSFAVSGSSLSQTLSETPSRGDTLPQRISYERDMTSPRARLPQSPSGAFLAESASSNASPSRPRRRTHVKGNSSELTAKLEELQAALRLEMDLDKEGPGNEGNRATKGTGETDVSESTRRSAVARGVGKETRDAAVDPDAGTATARTPHTPAKTRTQLETNKPSPHSIPAAPAPAPQPTAAKRSTTQKMPPLASVDAERKCYVRHVSMLYPAETLESRRPSFTSLHSDGGGGGSDA